MECIFHLAVLLCLSLAVSSASSQAAKFELVEEWTAWKGYHGKSYVSEVEELEKHLVWLSNKEYVEQHNENAHVFGFTLALNHLGDMVSLTACMHE